MQALTSDILAELGSDLGQPVATRLKVVRELQGQIREKRLQEQGVLLLWVKLEDLLRPEQEIDTRHQVWDFLADMLVGQQHALEMFRPQLFRYIKGHDVSEDLAQRVAVLGALTDTGKEIQHIEEQIGVFLLHLLHLVSEADDEEARAQVLALVSNMVRYNSAYLDQEVVAGLIVSLSCLATNSTKDQEILSCLDVLKSVVTYSYVPPEALFPFISCTCQVVNLPSLSSEAWDTTRKLLGTHLGHSALYNLCQIVQSPEHRLYVKLVRGAVYFIGCALWGPNRVPSLRYTAMSVLPFLISSLHSPHQPVLFEVAFQVRELVVGQGEQLTAPEWEETVTLLQRMVSRIDRCEEVRASVEEQLKATIGQMETLAMTERYTGSRTRLYELIESVSTLCPEASVRQFLEPLNSLLKQFPIRCSTY